MANKKNLAANSAIATTIAVVSFFTLAPLTAGFSCILGWTMQAIAASDMREFIIPDILTLPAIPTGLVATWLILDHAEVASTVLEHFLAAIGAGVGLYSVARLYEASRGHAGLGLGDVKLLAVGGAWIGWQGLPSVLLIASLAAFGFIAFVRFAHGTAVGAKTAVPFGVFLAPAIWIVWVTKQMPNGGF